MAQVTNTEQLYTRVQNISGRTRVFGYLGARGMRLAADEVVSVPSDLRSKLCEGTSLRKFHALERDLLAGIISIENTPPPVLYDEVGEVPQVLAFANGVLGTVDPTWVASGSSDFDPA